MIQFICSDGSSRGVIIKNVLNSANESILAGIIVREVQSLGDSIGPLVSQSFREIHEKMKFFNIVAVNEQTLVIEEIQNSLTLKDVSKVYSQST